MQQKIVKELMKTSRRLLNIKVSEDELNLIRKQAEEFAGGNVSGWIRYASMNLKPKSNQLVDVRHQATV